MSEYTPGPWRIVPWDRNPELAFVLDARGSDVSDTPEVQYLIEDARLIAAAPEMLAAARAILKALSYYEAADMTVATWWRTIGQEGLRPLRAAIAKAEGKEGSP